MLILTRRQDQKFLFPNLGISISVLSTAGKAVKLGIDAPKHVRVLREELASAVENIQAFHEPARQMQGMTSEERHEFRDLLNTATLGLQVLQQRIECGQIEDLESLIYRIFKSLHDLNDQLESGKQGQVTESRQAPAPRALIVEDNANEGQLLAEFLRFSGYEAQTVPNGLKAIEYLQQNEHPDIVLLDMNMPEMDGPETIRRLRTQPTTQNLRLYAVSGQDRDAAGVEVGREGVNRWFTKPVDARRLVDELNRELHEELVSA